MKIETKYNIGDRLFYIGDDEVKSFIVTHIRAAVYSEGMNEIIYEGSGGVERCEDILAKDLAGLKKITTDMFKDEQEAIDAD